MGSLSGYPLLWADILAEHYLCVTASASSTFRDNKVGHPDVPLGACNYVDTWAQYLPLCTNISVFVVRAQTKRNAVVVLDLTVNTWRGA